MKRHFLVSALLVPSALLIGGFMFFNNDGVRVSQAPHLLQPIVVNATAPETSGATTSGARTEVAVVSEGAESIRDQLRGIWGPDFALNSLEAERSGVNLDDQFQIYRWEELREIALPHFTVQAKEHAALSKHYLDWPELITADYLMSLDSSLNRAHIDESVLVAVEQIAAVSNRDIALETAVLVDLICAAKRSMIDSPFLVRSLLVSSPEAPPRGGDMLYAGSGTVANWRFSYAIYAEDFPEIPAQKAVLKQLKKERRREIRAFLATLH